ncbi:aspartate carbamoyltransferase catalytic subunit [bacterium]|nr:aspartate carbamoyltransferase catalytic subunit [bacterium]
MQLKSRHLLGLEGMPREEIELILDTAASLKPILERPIPKVPTLRGKTIANLFYEPSTRTRFSFELAEKRLSADSVSFSQAGSSVSKGETLKDTVRNLHAMKIDTVVIRHGASGAPHFLAGCLDASVVNAGDGTHEHPTQALLDMMTLREKLGKIEGLKVAIVGDILHSRVARSNIHGLSTAGASVGLCGPATLMPAGVNDLPVRVYRNLDEALEDADVFIVLRIQMERQKRGMFPSLREYRSLFGMTVERLEPLKKEITILHPGPINRGVELDDEVADGRHSVILDQVTNGVAVRMAVLYLLSGGRGKIEMEDHAQA